MTNDKTVTMSRELIEEVVAQLDDFITGDLLGRLKSALANHSEEPLGVVEPVAWAMESGLERCAKNPKATHAVYGHAGENGWDTPLFTAPPELAELQATIARLTAENERLKGRLILGPNIQMQGNGDGTITISTSQPAPVAVVQHPFADKVISKLQRFEECASDSGADGVDIGRHWLDLLTQLGLLNRVQRSPALWEITQQGEDCLDKVKELNTLTPAQSFDVAGDADGLAGDQ